MEPAKKKINLIIFDPLELICGDLHDMMLQHLNSKEIQIASEVSFAWNFIIAISPVCMSKIHLKQYLWKARRAIPEKLNILLKSQRRYQNLTIRIVNHPPEVAQNMFQLIKKHSPWLKSLTILGACKNTSELFSQSLTFPQLNSLDFNFWDESPAFINCTTLKKFSYHAGDCTQEAVDWIQSQTQLEDIKLTMSSKSNILDFNPVAPKGIKKFMFETQRNLTQQENVKMRNLMEPMCESLIELIYRGQCSNNLVFIVNEMPLLKKLDIDGNEIGNLVLQPNFSITSLIFRKNWNRLDHREALLLSLVNLEHLQIYVISIYDLTWIVKNLRNLKKLTTKNCLRYTAAPVLASYEAMKITENNINKNLEIVEYIHDE
jgi:hypothetical protein